MNVNVQPLVERNNAFALDLYTILSTNEGNLCISPYSVYVALAMTFAGARGATEKQMAKAMHISFTQYEFHKGFAQLLKQISAVGQEKNIELLSANSIYPHNRYSFLESFINCLKENYDTTVTPIDYSEPETSRKIINQWVKEKTQEHISELIPSGMLDPLTRLVLVNAIYFKGFWEKQFDKQKTVNSSFWVSSEKSVDVPTMRQKAGFKYTEDNQVQILELPYQSESVSLIIILPNARVGLAIIDKGLTSQDLSKWLTESSYETVDVHLPSFKIKSGFNLNEMLKSMGMLDAFDERADFSGMDGTQLIYLSDTIHQASIEVNEEGATATAATAVVAGTKSLPVEFQFHADHPFIYFLRENTTGSILFIGRVLNPAG